MDELQSVTYDQAEQIISALQYLQNIDYLTGLILGAITGLTFWVSVREMI